MGKYAGLAEKVLADNPALGDSKPVDTSNLETPATATVKIADAKVGSKTTGRPEMEEFDARRAGIDTGSELDVSNARHMAVRYQSKLNAASQASQAVEDGRAVDPQSLRIQASSGGSYGSDVIDQYVNLAKSFDPNYNTASDADFRFAEQQYTAKLVQTGLLDLEAYMKEYAVTGIAPQLPGYGELLAKTEQMEGAGTLTSPGSGKTAAQTLDAIYSMEAVEDKFTTQDILLYVAADMVFAPLARAGIGSGMKRGIKKLAKQRGVTASWAATKVSEYTTFRSNVKKLLYEGLTQTERTKLLKEVGNFYVTNGFKEAKEGILFSVMASGIASSDMGMGAEALYTVMGAGATMAVLGMSKVMLRQFWATMRDNAPSMFQAHLAKLTRSKNNPIVREVLEAAENLPKETEAPGVTNPIRNGEARGVTSTEVIAEALRNGTNEADWGKMHRLATGTREWVGNTVAAARGTRRGAHRISSTSGGKTVVVPTADELKLLSATDSTQDALDWIRRANELGSAGQPHRTGRTGVIAGINDAGEHLVKLDDGGTVTIPQGLAVGYTGLDINQGKLQGMFDKLNKLMKKKFPDSDDLVVNVEKGELVHPLTGEPEGMAKVHWPEGMKGRERDFPPLIRVGAADAFFAEVSQDELLAASERLGFSVSAQRNMTEDEFFIVMLHELGHIMDDPNKVKKFYSEDGATLWSMRNAARLGVDMTNVRPGFVATLIDAGTRNVEVVTFKGDEAVGKMQTFFLDDNQADEVWNLWESGSKYMNRDTRVGEYRLRDLVGMLLEDRVEEVAEDITKGSLVKNIDPGDYLDYLLANPRVKKWQKAQLASMVDGDVIPTSALGDAASAAEQLGRNAGRRLEWKTINDVGPREQKVTEIIETRMGDRGEIEFGSERNVTLKNKKIRNKTTLGQILTSPSSWLGDFKEALLDIPWKQYLQTARLQTQGMKAWNSITDGLSNQEFDGLLHALETARDMDTALVPTRQGFVDPVSNELVIQGTTANVIDAYKGARKLMDTWWSLGNGAMVRHAKNSGWKMTADGQIMKPVKDLERPLMDANNRAFKPQIHEAYELPDGRVVFVDTDPAMERMVPYKDVPDNTSLMPHRDGYMPVIYKAPHRIARFRRQNGQLAIEFVATADTSSEAKRAMLAMKEVDEEGWAYLSMRHNENLFDFKSDDWGVLHSMSDQDLKLLKSELIDLGVDAASIQQLENNIITYNMKRSVHMKQRGERLRSAKDIVSKGGYIEQADFAELVPTQRSLATYMQRMSRYVSHSEYNSQLEQAFVNEFGGQLKGNRWDSPWQDGTVLPRMREGELVRKQMRTIFGVPDDYLNRKVAEWRVAADQRFSLAASHPEADMKKVEFLEKSVNFMLDNIFDAPQKAKAIGATTKLGLWNFSQTVVQATGALNTLGAYALKPHIASKGIADYSKAAVWHRNLEALSSVRSRVGRELWAEAELSGYFDVIQFDALQRLAEGNYGKTGWVQKVKSTHNIFYQAGEDVNKGIAWFTERANLLDEIKKGESALEAGSQEFLDEVSSRATRLSLNMSKYNQPGLAKGILGATFGQFKQFGVHQVELMKSPDLQLSQKLGIFGAWAGTFGLAGIPFFWDAAAIVESSGQLLSKHFEDDKAAPESGEKVYDPVWKNKLLREIIIVGSQYDPSGKLAKAIRGGAITVTPVLEDFEISHRVGLGNVIESYIEGLDFQDLAGPGLSTLYEVAAGTLKTVRDADTILANAEASGGEKAGRIVRDMAYNLRSLSGPGNMLEGVSGAMNDEITGKNAELLLSNPDWEELALIATGFSPTRLVQARDKQEIDIEHSMVWKKFIRRRAAKYVKMMKDNPNIAKNVMAWDVQRMAQHDPSRLGLYQKQIMYEMISHQMPLDQRSKFLGNQFVLDVMEEF